MNGKCSRHGTLIQYRDVGNGKSVQYCPDCAKDQSSFIEKLFIATQKKADSGDMWDSAEGKNFGAQIADLTKQLEASKQRELELLAVITNIQNAFNFAMEMASEGDKSDLEMAHSKVVEALNFEPSQALREHEANVLEELLDTFAFFQTEEGLWLADAIRSMAEERRKK